MLSRILNAHPRIGIPLESLLYDTFWPLRERYGDLSEPHRFEQLLRHMTSWSPVAQWQPEVPFERILAAVDRRDFHGAFRAVVKAWADAVSKPVWGEKSPWHAFYWREILEGFPEARVIHIIRDPRDSSLSWKRARQGPRNVFVLARRWAAYQDVMDAVRAGWPAERYHELHYEALVEDPEACCRAMCRFLGEDYDEAMLAFHKADDRYNTDNVNRENLTKPVMKDNFGKWREQLSPEEIRWIESVAGDRMTLYGYERHLDGATMSGAERARIKYLSHPISRITGMLQDRQGQREALEKLRFRRQAGRGLD